jgi:hypothetical protein
MHMHTHKRTHAVPTMQENICVSWEMRNANQARSQTMNTVGAVAFSVGTIYMYTLLYIYIKLHYRFTVYMSYICVRVKSSFVRTTKSTLSLYNIVQNILYINKLFENEVFLTTAV